MFARLFTSESVTEGHPDKLCDQISDAILDEIISKDSNARVACECATTTGMVMIMGEVSTTCSIDYTKVARNAIKVAGYDDPAYGFDYKSCAILSSIDKQSDDIALGVNSSVEHKHEKGKTAANLIGAGDQGMMFGYACDETPELMPAPIMYAHKLTRKLSDSRKTKLLPWLRPDGKAQVTVLYDKNGNVQRIPTIVVSTQHAPDVSFEELRDGIMDCVIKPTIDAKLLDKDTTIYINPTGRFVIGGPVGDSGLTGRKIIVDTYGGAGAHGGGCFSGKDPTKVDRSGAYMARYDAKNVVAAGLAKKCQLEVAYAIGVANPVSIMVETFGTGIIPDDEIAKLVKQHFDFRPAQIIDQFDLRRPIYHSLAAFGHFGRTDLDLGWEKTDKIENLRITR